MAGSIGAGGSIDIESGVSLFTGEGFCNVRVGGTLLGQLTPAQVREMAIGWLEAAEAAETDAIVFEMLTKDVGLDGDTAGQFLLAMREKREADRDGQ